MLKYWLNYLKNLTTSKSKIWYLYLILFNILMMLNNKKYLLDILMMLNKSIIRCSLVGVTTSSLDMCLVGNDRQELLKIIWERKCNKAVAVCCLQFLCLPVAQAWNLLYAVLVPWQYFLLKMFDWRTFTCSASNSNKTRTSKNLELLNNYVVYTAKPA